MHQMYQFSAAQHVLNLFVPRWSKGIRARGHTETLESVPLQRTLPPTEFDVCQARVAKALGTRKFSWWHLCTFSSAYLQYISG